MATHPSVLAWKIPWTEGPGSLQSMGSKKLDMTEQLSTHTEETMDNNTDSYLCFKFTFEFH